MASRDRDKTMVSGFEEYGATEPIGSFNSTDRKTEPVPQGGAFADYSATEASGSSRTPVYNPVQDFDRYTNTGGDPFPGTTPPPRGSGFTNYEPTQPSGGFSGYGPTQPSNGFSDYGPTQPSNAWERSGGVTEPFFPGQQQVFLPVVGWLICVEGPERGRDYRIHDGYNSIGRAQNMDICISGDPEISREKHAVVAYDPDEKRFYFAPADGKNLVKLNGKTLMMAGELKAYDTLMIGSSRFKFIPFCGESFSWTEEM